MKKNIATLIALCALASSAFAAAPAGFKVIFDGKSLAGWDGNKDVWTIRDGALTGQTTAEKGIKANTFLVYTGIKMALPSKDAEVDPEHNAAVRLFRRFFPVAPKNDHGHFFTVHNGKRMATPMFIVLLVIETTDVVFALDSLPAVLAITKDSFVALTSNIFAILGLRSLYFALSGIMSLFRFLKVGLAVILVFIGVKMLIEHWVQISTATSLGVIGAVLTTSVLMSALIKPPAKAE